jgi:hypothetical protein
MTHNGCKPSINLTQYTTLILCLRRYLRLIHISKVPLVNKWVIEPKLILSQRLDKPILFDSLDDNAGLRQLPEDVRQLYYDIFATTQYQTGIYPAEIRIEIEALCAGHPPLGSVYRKPEGGNDQDGIGQEEERFFDYLPVSALFAGTIEGATFQARIARAEFYKVRDIKDRARECLALRRAEAA